MLYELCSGRQPFAGDYEAATLYSVVHEEPEALPDDVPLELQHIVFRCIEKDAGNRYESAERLLAALREIKHKTDANEQSATIPKKQKSGNRTVLALAGAVVVLLALIAAQLGGLFKTDRTVPRLTNARQITSAIGLEDHPTWSPDGGRLAYHSHRSGNWDIWVKQIGGGEPLNMTADHPGKDMYPAWSPDGNQIAFLSDRDSGAVYIIPAIGGIAKKAVDLEAATFDQLVEFYLQWSPDGTRLLYPKRISPEIYDAETYTLTTGNKQRLALPLSHEKALYPNWSPDGLTIAYVDARSGYPTTQAASLHTLNLQDQKSRRA